MKISDNPPKVIDEVIAEVRSVKRGISERYGNDINRLLESLISQERASGISKAEQVSADQSATAVGTNSEDGENDKPDSEARS